jgi:hypothetical protein
MMLFSHILAVNGINLPETPGRLSTRSAERRGHLVHRAPISANIERHRCGHGAAVSIEPGSDADRKN